MQALYFQTGHLLLENNDAQGSQAQLGLGFCDHKRAPAMRSRIKDKTLPHLA